MLNSFLWLCSRREFRKRELAPASLVFTLLPPRNSHQHSLDAIMAVAALSSSTFLDGNTFYALINLDKTVVDPEERITTDVRDFAENVSELFSSV